MNSIITNLTKDIIICEQTKTIYHIEETINLLESIGLLVEGDGCKSDTNNNNIGNHLYAALTHAYDTILTQYVKDKTTMSNDDIDDINNTLSSIIAELHQSHNLSNENILALYSIKMKKYES